MTRNIGLSGEEKIPGTGTSGSDRTVPYGVQQAQMYFPGYCSSNTGLVSNMSITLSFTLSSKEQENWRTGTHSFLLVYSSPSENVAEVGAESVRQTVLQRQHECQRQTGKSLWIAQWMIYSQSHGQALAISLGAGNALPESITHQSIRQPATDGEIPALLNL